MTMGEPALTGELLTERMSDKSRAPSDDERRVRGGGSRGMASDRVAGRCLTTKPELHTHVPPRAPCPRFVRRPRRRRSASTPRTRCCAGRSSRSSSSTGGAPGSRRGPGGRATPPSFEARGRTPVTRAPPPTDVARSGIGATAPTTLARPLKARRQRGHARAARPSCRATRSSA